MNEPIDKELNRALKESAKQLQGWEFTPQMRRNVLERIRAEEEAGPVSTQRPVQRSNRSSLVRPLTWVAAAAAALLLMLQTDLGQIIPPMGSSGAKGAGEDRVGMLADEPSAGILEFVPSTNVVTLPAPEMEPGARAKGPQAQGTEAFTLAVPHEVKYALRASAANHQVVELSSGGARALDQAGNQLWVRPLVGVTAKSKVAVADTGLTAVTAGTDLHILDQAGNIRHTVNLSGEVGNLTWSRDGRLAVAEEQAVNVYRDGALQFSKNGTANADVAFGASGELAVRGDEAESEALRVYDQAGREVLNVKPTAAGRGVAMLDSTVVAGNQAFTMSGEPAWSVPVVPEGLVQSEAEPLLIAWNGTTATAITAEGGILWETVQSDTRFHLHQAVPSTDGQYVALLGESESAGALWVLDRWGNVLRAIELGAAPTGAAFLEGQVLLLLPNGLELIPIR